MEPAAARARSGDAHWLWCCVPLAAALVEMPWLFSLQPEYRRRSAAPDFTRLDAWLFDAVGLAPVAIGFAVACCLLLRRRPRSRALLAVLVAGAAACGLLLAALLPVATGAATSGACAPMQDAVRACPVERAAGPGESGPETASSA